MPHLKAYGCCGEDGLAGHHDGRLLGSSRPEMMRIGPRLRQWEGAQMCSEESDTQTSDSVTNWMGAGEVNGHSLIWCHPLGKE